jgi:ABC-type nitrate/sulfonate/bicarbonate transport system substrate-binding protein
LGKASAYKSVILFIAILVLFLEFPPRGRTAVAPVGQLPLVAVSVTPSVYALPILLVEKAGEWKDFGIQVKVKVHPNGEEQLDRSVASEWEVAVMDPLSAVKGGNEGNVAIVGIAGNFASQLSFLNGRSGVPPQSGKWAEWLKGYIARTESKGGKPFLPACLVASSNYADTRKTLVIRWLEGYSRGIQIIKKNPEAAASLLKEFYGEALKREVSLEFLRQDIRGAFFFDEKDREEPFRGKEGKPSLLEEFAGSMTQYLKGVKALGTEGEPSDYILSRLCDQLSALRGEAVAQLEKTRGSIEAAAQLGARMNDFRKTWEESKTQIQEGRGCLAVIGVLSNLQRSADHVRVNSARLSDFRRIEMAVGGFLAVYYAGYFYHRRRRAKAHDSKLMARSPLVT